MTIGAEPKTRSDDRIFIFEAIDGTLPKSVYGLTDPALIEGTNRLHAVKDHETCLWYFRQERGYVPERLKCQFTSFKAAKKHAEMYYNSRNIKITEVID